MKITTLLIAVTLSWTTTYAQSDRPPKTNGAKKNDKADGEVLLYDNVFKDSQTIFNYYGDGTISDADKSKIKAILATYQIKSIDELNVFLMDLKPVFGDGNMAKTTTDVSQPSAGSSIAKLFAPTAIVDGFGIILAERFKEEMTIAYLDALIKKIENLEATHNISKILPTTYETTTTVKEEVWLFRNYLNTLKEAIKNDITEAPDNIIPFLHSFGNLNNDEALAVFILDIAIQSFKGEDPIHLLAQIENSQLTGLDQGAERTAKILRLISQNFQNHQGNYLGAQELKQLEDTTFMKVFIGLAIQKGKINSLIDDSSITWLESQASNVTQIYAILKEFESISSDIHALKDQNGAVSADQKIDFVESTIGSIQGISQKLNLVDGMPNKYFALAFELIELKGFINEEKYGVAILKIKSIVNSFDGLSSSPKIPPAIMEFIEEYGLFFANLAQAETGEEVKLALDAVILPVGSYRLKRAHESTISLQAYPGIGGGYEKSLVDDLDGGTLGPIAPIGIDYAIGRKGTEKNGLFRSHSWFITLVDIGAVFGFHLTEQEGEFLDYSDDFKWKHVFTPGFYHVWHSRKVLSVGLGAQYNAFGLSIEDNNTLVSENARLVSFKLFIAADIPLFTLNTKKPKLND